jgi:dihydrofolate reductase
MGTIAISQSISLDGVMQAPGGPDEDRSGGFEHGGWAMDDYSGPQGDRFDYAEELGIEQAQNAEALMLGRVTHEILAGYWPTAEGQLADRINELPKYVVSSTLTDPSWNATVLGGLEDVTRLREELDGEILVYGSRRLSQALIERGLVDELRLMVAPVVLGSGNRLFEEAEGKIPMRLVESRPLGGGVVYMVHAPALGSSL